MQHRAWLRAEDWHVRGQQPEYWCVKTDNHLFWREITNNYLAIRQMPVIRSINLNISDCRGRLVISPGLYKFLKTSVWQFWHRYKMIMHNLWRTQSIFRIGKVKRKIMDTNLSAVCLNFAHAKDRLWEGPHSIMLEHLKSLSTRRRSKKFLLEILWIDVKIV